MGETRRKERAVIRVVWFTIHICGMSVCSVLIQKASCSGRASGSNGTILWSLRKSLISWQQGNPPLCFGKVPMCMKAYPKAVGS